MRRPAVPFAVTLALLVTAGVLIVLPNEARPVVQSAVFELFPAQLPPWKVSDGVPLDLVVLDPRAAEHLLRTYADGQHTIWAAVGYYRGEREGRYPAGRDLLFPSRGWSDITEREISVALDDRGRTIDVNAIAMRSGAKEFVTLYWYQVGTAAVANDHRYRARLLVHRLLGRRTDSALVRITSPVPDGQSREAVVQAQVAFLKAFVPDLVRAVAR